jgi:1-acyl-sn-glycerol-3-phosphate acyltransferase
MAMARSVVDARKRLCNGMSLVVFPEGTRTLDGKMLSFKKGAFKLAMDFKLPLVPITIDGAYKVLPRTSKFDVKHGKIIITIHRPIMPVTEGKADLASIMKETYDAKIGELQKAPLKDKADKFERYSRLIIETIMAAALIVVLAKIGLK